MTSWGLIKIFSTTTSKPFEGLAMNWHDKTPCHRQQQWSVITFESFIDETSKVSSMKLSMKDLLSSKVSSMILVTWERCTATNFELTIFSNIHCFELTTLRNFILSTMKLSFNKVYREALKVLDYEWEGKKWENAKALHRRQFREWYGIDPPAIMAVFESLENTTNPDNKIKKVKLFPLLVCISWFKRYPTLSVLAKDFRITEKTCESYTWTYARAIEALRGEKVREAFFSFCSTFENLSQSLLSCRFSGLFREM